MKNIQIGTLLLFTIVAACTAPLTTEQRSRIHTLGVISLLGDRVTLSYSGLFDRSHDKIPLPDAQFDTLAEKAIVECGKVTNPTLDFSKIPIHKQPLIDKIYEGGLMSFTYGSTVGIVPDLSAWLKQNPVDAVVIVREMLLPIRGAGQEESFDGLGLHKSLSYGPRIYGTFGIVVRDSALQQIASREAKAFGGEYPTPMQTVRDELAAGKRIPLVPILQRIVQDETCKMVKSMNL
jgi:hypothetical protein